MAAQGFDFRVPYASGWKNKSGSRNRTDTSAAYGRDEAAGDIHPQVVVNVTPLKKAAPPSGRGVVLAVDFGFGVAASLGIGASASIGICGSVAIATVVIVVGIAAVGRSADHDVDDYDDDDYDDDCDC